MKSLTSITVLTVVAVALVCATPSVSQAQCTTCATPQVAYSPVVYNSYVYDGWYLGKYLGRWGRRVFGVAPAAAYQVGYPTTYAAAYPQTYTVGYAPRYSYATSYTVARPALCITCACSPCCCTRTTYRPVVMQPVQECNTCCSVPICNTCDPCSTCSTVGQALYETSTPAHSNCPNCTTSYTGPSSNAGSAPSLPANTPAPPKTFTDKPVTDLPADLDPIPAEESSFDDQGAAGWDEAPQLLDPRDKLTKSPTAPVWTAVYKQPASDSAKTRRVAKPVGHPKQAIGWTSGRWND